MSTRRNKLAALLSTILVVISMFSLFTASPRNFSGVQPVGQAPTTTSLTNAVTLHGRGASFPNPLIQVWANEYHKENSNVTLSYLSVGSGGGQSAFLNKTDDFDASDAPLSPTQRLLAPNVLHIPETIGSVVLAYNLPAPVPQGLNLTGDIIARIYLGKILFWNDSAIQAINPTVVLPKQQITTVHRFDGSGTTFVFTSFLCEDNTFWLQNIGNGTKVLWPGNIQGSPPPIALSGNTNTGVAQVISSTLYSFGYLELSYALTTPGVHYASVANPKGFFITPTLQSTSYAVSNSTATLPPGSGDWSQVRLLNALGNQTYPIASFTYFLVYKELNVVPSMDLNETVQKNALVQFLYWAVNRGQLNSTGPTLAYVQLPLSVRLIDNASIASITLTISSSTVPRSFSLSASSAGWNGIVPGPTLVAYSGDPVTLTLSSSDGITHQWFVDFNNNLALDSNETASSPFTSGTTLSFSPTIGVNIPVSATGNYTYRDLANPSTVYGTIRIIPQQAAAAIPVANGLKTANTPLRDTTLLTTIGSLIVDLRALNVSGSVTLIGADSTSGLITSGPATFQISKLHMLIPGGQTNLQAKFLLNAHVSPNDLSSDIIVVLNTNGLTASANRPTATRELDMLAKGVVNVNDVSVLASAFGSNLGDTRYNALADFFGSGHVNIFDVAIFENFWQAPVNR